MNEELPKTSDANVLSSRRKLRKTLGGGIQLVPPPPPPLERPRGNKFADRAQSFNGSWWNTITVRYLVCFDLHHSFRYFEGVFFFLTDKRGLGVYQKGPGWRSHLNYFIKYDQDLWKMTPGFKPFKLVKKLFKVSATSLWSLMILPLFFNTMRP